MGNKKELLETIVGACQDVEGKNNLACAKAFQLAKKFNVPITEIGNICNKNSIRICSCQLGCFK